MQRAGAAGNANNVVAGILALFLGGFGVHRFYLAAVSDFNRAVNILLGVLGLLFSWTFLPMLIAVVEGLVFLVSKDKFDEKYNT